MSWRVSTEDTALVIIDVQEKLLPVIHNHEYVFKTIKTLVRGCHLLNIPIYASEQYPKGLGKTISGLLENIQPIEISEKTAFSAASVLCHISKQHLILCGIEAHICVRESALDFLEQKKKIVIAEDAVGSRSTDTKRIAMEELRNQGVRISSSESLLFELMQNSNHKQFKEISKLVK